MSDQILLTGIHGFGYHGVFEHERTNGPDWIYPVGYHDGLGACRALDAGASFAF